MATTIDYGSDYENPSATIFHGMNDYGAEASDYRTTMAENSSATIDYDGLAHEKICPICVTALIASGHTSVDKHLAECGPRCAWYDASKERCAVLTIARGR